MGISAEGIERDRPDTWGPIPETAHSSDATYVVSRNKWQYRSISTHPSVLRTMTDAPCGTGQSSSLGSPMCVHPRAWPADGHGPAWPGDLLTLNSLRALADLCYAPDTETASCLINYIQMATPFILAPYVC